MTVMKISNHFNLFLILFLVTAISLSGCQQLGANTATENNTAITEETVKPENLPENSPEITQNTQNTQNNMNLPRLEGKATVVMKINGESVTIEVDGDNAPITAGNFVDLVQKGIYNGLVFHRVVKEPQPFVVQGGDPQGKNPNFPVANLGTGGYNDPTTKAQRYIPLEIRPEYDAEKKDVVAPEIIYSTTIKEPPQLKHDYGTIAMARSQSPDSASSQFYFTLADLPFLDGSYAVFGKVTEGMDVVENIKQGDRIESAEVISGGENLKLGK
jgi:peptidyl-prolyl cis-trans isomerase B (cyclophilin B)